MCSDSQQEPQQIYKKMAELTVLEAFGRARKENGHESADAVASRIGVSRRYLYECIRYPDKNPRVFHEVVDYISKANVKDFNSSTNKVEAEA